MKSSAAQKVAFPCGLCSLKVVVLYVCHFHCENVQREGQKACVCHYSTYHLRGFRWQTWSLMSAVLSASPLDVFAVDWVSQVGTAPFPVKPVPSAVWPGSLNSNFLPSLQFRPKAGLGGAGALQKTVFLTAQWYCQSGFDNFSHFENINIEENQRITCKNVAWYFNKAHGVLKRVFVA